MKQISLSQLISTPDPELDTVSNKSSNHTGKLTALKLLEEHSFIILEIDDIQSSNLVHALFHESRTAFPTLTRHHYQVKKIG